MRKEVSGNIMKNVLHGRQREDLSKGYTTKIRKEGSIPGVLYGLNKESCNIELDEPELLKTLKVVGEHGAVAIDLDGNTENTVIKETQRHPVSNKIIHVDFQRVDAGQMINAKVPIMFEGEDLLVRKGYISSTQMNELEVQCIPEHLPRYITVNISELKPGDIILVKDIVANENITIVDDKDLVVTSIVYAEVEKEAEEGEAAASVEVPLVGKEKEE
jgi:large subunit ribosomal protein L25